MRNLILSTVLVVFVVGCAAIRDLSSFHMKDGRGVVVMGAFGEPDKDWQCKKVGKEGYNPGDKTILGVEIKKDYDEADAEQRKRIYFVARAINHDANYIDMPGEQTSGFGDLYSSSDTTYADYYHCKQLPQPPQAG